MEAIMELSQLERIKKFLYEPPVNFFSLLIWLFSWNSLEL